MAMEDVWKDINLSSLHDLRNSNFSGMSLHDFLSRPRDKDSHPPPPPPPPPYAAVNGGLNLNSAPEIHFSGKNIMQPPTLPHQYSVSCSPVSPPAGLNPAGRKRVQDSGDASDDHRHKRMIKNRESAARSRARKQAYTNELELEVAHLMKENAKLLKQYQQLSVEASAAPKNRRLYRTSSAPL